MTYITVSDILITVIVIRRLDYERQCKKWRTYRSDLYILLSLYTPKHGYAVMQFVEEKTGGRLSLGAGTLYGALNSLQDKSGLNLMEIVREEKRIPHYSTGKKKLQKKSLQD